jgi:hypothetical protein
MFIIGDRGYKFRVIVQGSGAGIDEKVILDQPWRWNIHYIL